MLVMTGQRYIKINLIKIAIALLTIKYLISSMTIIALPSWFDSMIVGFAMAVFVLKAVKERFVLKEFLLFGIVSLFVLYTCVQIQEYEFLVNIIALFLLKGEKFEEYVRMTFRIEFFTISLVFLVTLVMSFCGHYDEFWMYTEERLRFTGGFVHPNTLASYSFSCILKYIWIQYDCMTKNKYAALLLISCVLYGFTKTRTTFLITVGFFLLLFISKRETVKNLVEKYLKFLFPALLAAMYYCIKNYVNGNAVINLFDKFLTGRIRLGSYSYTLSGVTVLPKYLEYKSKGVEWTETWGITSFTFDSLYSFLLMQLGILWCVLLTVLICQLIKKTNFKGHIFILIWIAYAMTEVYGLNCFKVFPAMLFAFLFNKETQDEKAIKN